MTWINAPYALDGTLIPSSLARLGQYVATGGAEGIAQISDLKVVPLDTPGNGVKIYSGGVAILNRYQGEIPDQTYMAYNPTGDILGAGDMPPSSASARSHLVCVVVGDPEFSSVGHPFMLATDPPVGTEDTFQYVRTVIIQNVPASTTSFDQLNLNYPAYALARIDLPANTTTVQSNHITDLREMAAPRNKIEQWHVSAAVADPLSVAVANTYEYWPDNSQKLVFIPKWASYVYITGFIEGFRIASSIGAAKMRIGSLAAGIATPASAFDDTMASGNADRRAINMGGFVYIPPAYRGTNQYWQIQATVTATSQNNKLNTDSWTTCMVQLRFAEVPD